MDNDNNEEDNGIILSGACIVLPHFITRRSFCRQPLAQTRNGWLLFARSAALFVITRHPAIVEDTPILGIHPSTAQRPRTALTMTTRRQGSTWCASPPPAAGTSSLPSRQGSRRRRRERQSQTSSRRPLPLLPGSRVVHPPLRGRRPSRIWTTTTTTSTTSTTTAAASGDIDEEQRLPPSVLPTPLSAARSVIHRFRHRAIVNTFAAGRCPLSPTFISRCPVTSARRARRFRNDIVTLARESVCFLLCEWSRFNDDWAREGEVGQHHSCDFFAENFPSGRKGLSIVIVTNSKG